MKSRYKTVIEPARGPGATVALVPQEFVPALGGLKQTRALGELNGQPFTTSTFPYRGALYVGVPKAVREAAGVVVGDEVELELELDTRPRVLELAPELEAALAADPGLRARFDALSFSRKRELAEPVADAKKPETRAVRVDKAIGRLRELD